MDQTKYSIQELSIGNEWITAPLLIKFIKDFCFAYSRNLAIYNKSAKSIYNNSSIYIIPMVNPDGVDLVTKSISMSSKAFIKAQNISKKFANIPFPNGWKANINGVDF